MPYKISLIATLLIALVGCGSDDPSINKTKQSMSVEQAQQAVINSTGVDHDIADEHYAQYDDDEQDANDSNDNDDKIEVLPPMSVTDQHDADQGEVILMDDDDVDIDDDDADQE